ncbi:CRISPR-associated protein, Cmr2 family [Clostridium sp. DSM 8431]|uniref:type III-B CRISPR-associated protein Cas10/Cmr2 n=1 Tax=Clostridium sp. DSM 8431 TaxID=1761781 RepID=UPI0008F0B14B|nr:type III-B CRISPR-associated protein Cas10/Cmr2 [Clostridium sp. DSM 8431]SFU71077.1 CRISPR-associated protein, Cmr2 family [Clostridium sp. DSM 8431]
MSTYIGVTIGPISKTINKARSTGELWGSSYIFSYIMKNIISKLIDYKKGEKVIISPDKFIVPNILDKSNNAINTDLFENTKAGLFHDRLIFKSDKDDFKKLYKVIKEVKLDLVDKICFELSKLSCDKLNKTGIEKYIKNYFKIYFIEVDVKENESIIGSVSKYLDAIELREKYLEEEEEDYIFKIFGTDTNKNNVKNTFLTDDAFQYKEDKEILYPSIIRIATKELNIPKNKKYNSDDELIKYLNKNEYKERLRKYHEYVALVQIDGDSMGKVIKNLTNNDKCKKFSKKLLEYSKDAVTIINNYGGFPIYAGGDDLLFFAPIKNSKSESSSNNIFQLFNELDFKFNEKFKDYKESNPSISIGMEVFHQKYPLYTVIPDTANLLFEDAKNFKCGNTEKNALAFKLVKSSGENFSATLMKSGQTYNKFIELFNNISSSTNDKDIKDTLNQIHIRFLRDKKILNEIGNCSEKLNNYFDNNFNEDIHKEKRVLNFIKNIKEFIVFMYEEYGNSDDISITNIYACLKFIRFINEESNLLEKGDE